MGSTSNGSLKITDGPDALRFELKPTKTSYSDDVLSLISAGTITGTSFGFKVQKDDWREDSKRYIEKAQLIEISPCSMPAYPQTSVSTRGYKNMNINELRQKRGELLHEMRTLNDSGLDTNEKRQKYDKMDSDFEEMTRKIKLAEREQQMSRSQGVIAGKPATSLDGYDARSILGNFNEGEVRVFSPGTYKPRTWTDAEIRSASRQLGFETRVTPMQVDVDPAGGYAVGEVMASQIIADKMNMVYLRQLSTIVECRNGSSLGAISWEEDPDEAEWTSELKSGALDTSAEIGKRQLFPHPLAKRLKISATLVRKNSRIADFVKTRMAYKFAVPEENAFLNGDGVNKPLGCMVASDAGISTSQDISTGNTATAITFDGLINCKYALPKVWRMSSSLRWGFHRDAIKMLRKIKDGEGNYVWRMGQGGEPDTILEDKFFESEYMPNTFSANQLIGIYGDFSQYWIADSLDFRIVVADQIYIETNELGYFGRAETDAMPVNENGFRRVKLGS